MSTLDREAVELFLQEASENLQYLREYVSVLQDVEPRREDLERLYISAHTLSGTSASYGFPRFSEIAGKLAHVFQYALNAPLGSDLHGPLTEFLSDGISLLETDLLEISDTGKESVDDIAVFKERYRFAFPAEPPALNLSQPDLHERFAEEELHESIVAAATGSYFDALPTDDEVPDEILEFFQPEAEEHLQVVSDCLISLEGNNNPEEINKLFRAIHTVKGSAAQVGLKRLGAIAHRVEDLIGRMRDGELEPTPQVIDLCLVSTDVLKKTLQKQWADEADMRNGVDSLLAQIAEFAPVETLSFSKERLQGKVAEFQEKYEYNKLSSNWPLSKPQQQQPTRQMLTSAAAGDSSFLSEFSELEMDRYDDVNILSRSMTEISADVNEVLTQLGGFIGRVEGDIDEFTKRSEEHTSELQSRLHLVCRLLLEKKK